MSESFRVPEVLTVIVDFIVVDGFKGAATYGGIAVFAFYSFSIVSI